MRRDGPPVVLVVDDNAATRYSTSRILRSASFDILEAATGMEAIEQAEKQPDAVVLDVNLPDIDGFEVCRQLRSKEKTARTPIIHLSATFVDAGDKVRGLEAGADGYLTHPVEPPVLVATVNAFLRARQAEDKMRLSEQKFRAIFDQAINGIALMSDEQVYLEVNPAMCRMLGRDRAEIVGRRAADFVPTGYELQDREILHKLEANREWTGSFPLARPDGSMIELDWNVSMHSLPGVRVVVVSDATERRSAELERERLLASERNARAEAERANRIKDEFLATVSHELRSPLSAIIGWSHVLKLHGSNDPEDLRTGILAIERNAKMQEQLIADLLDVSRIASGKLRLNLQKVDLSDTVRHTFEAFREPAAAKQIDIVCTDDLPRPVIQGDPVRLQQVLGNLLSNAIKFTTPGGRVTVNLDVRGDHVDLSVTDTGKGIRRDFLPYVFDTFRQESSSSTRSHEGLGLGLSIVRQLVEMHGGTVSVDSEGENRGATFVATFPLARVADGDVAPPARQVDEKFNRKALRGLRVLVVDDDPDARMIVRRLLVDYDVEMFEAESVAEALQVVDRCRPQLLLSDIGMPGSDGYELLRSIRAKGYGADRLPAIALTAFIQPDDKTMVISSGFQAHLAKPVHPHELIVTIASVAQGSAD
jgi:PAS domain S-box-containing protein